ncbi:MAG: amino acid permease [Saprospiraceae bacterium]|nr:amino acid permease [Saprospiraceae bacterium]
MGESTIKKFGTFGGVFTPTLLTILGVIMYLRLGWVVGNAGLLGAWLIIIISFLITTCTALSMSSVSTNIRIGAGGAYAIVSKSLGLEIGGSLGIPRYISQGLAVTMYIFGFREGWLSVFPGHNAFLVDIVVFVLLFAIAYKSANLAIRTQYIIMAIILCSLISIVLAAYYGSMEYSTIDAAKWGNFKGSIENDFTGTNFWLVFAVFFPASTGIMAGANMSGELKNPRHSILYGTMWAVGISFVIYMLLAYWAARSATETELLTNYNIMIDRSFYGPAVIAGVLGATFSSALASIVGSSRILQAMGEHDVIPKGNWLAIRNKSGEPRNAMVVTGIMVFVTMLMRDLNAIAPLVTMFFLITYTMLNLVVIIEQNLGLVSFRPTFKINKIIPWIGLITSISAMFIINAMLSLISVLVVFAFYFYLTKRDLNAPFEDVRSGLFVSFAEWAAKNASLLSRRQERAWKPNLLVPVTNAQLVHGDFYFLKNIAYPKGSVKLMGIGTGSKTEELSTSLFSISQAFQKRGVFGSWSVLRTNEFAKGVNFGIQALEGAFFNPNIVYLNLRKCNESPEELSTIIKEAIFSKIGVLLFVPHLTSGFGQRQTINVWIRDRSPRWQISWDIGNLDLSILIAYKLQLNWGANIRLITVIENEEEMAQARKFMDGLMDLARLPQTEKIVVSGNFFDYLKKAPIADLNIFGMLPEPDFDSIYKVSEQTNSSCLFVRDSGYENVMA